jgi:hypothetical protein
MQHISLQLTFDVQCIFFYFYCSYLSSAIWSLVLVLFIVLSSRFLIGKEPTDNSKFVLVLIKLIT